MLSSKVGMVLVVLGGMHLFNVYVFNAIRRRALDRERSAPHAALTPPAKDWSSSAVRAP